MASSILRWRCKPKLVVPWETSIKKLRSFRNGVDEKTGCVFRS
jgi:hypothetical protein